MKSEISTTEIFGGVLFGIKSYIWYKYENLFMKNLENLQSYLPLGYLYLVILGIIKETVHFYQLGINILKYSTLMDILIGPIADLMSHPLIVIGFLSLLLAGYQLMKRIFNKGSEKYFHAFFGKNKPREEFTNQDFNRKIIEFFAFLMASFFLGIGLGEGRMVAEKSKKNVLKYNYKLNYNTGEAEEVYLVDNNSVYYFYFSKGDKHLKIAPISTIKNLEIIHNKRLDDNENK